MPTPQTLAEAESLFSGNRSPVPALDLGSGRAGADSAIPGLDIDPPDLEVEDGKPLIKTDGEGGEGIGGWISNMVKRGKSNGEGDSESGKYKRVGQDDDNA